MKLISSILCLIAVAFLSPAGAEVTGDELVTALQQMEAPQPDLSTARSVNDLTISSTDCDVVLYQGKLHFFKPITLAGTARYYGAIFSGVGTMRFAPSLPMEQNQLARFFHSDSLDRTFTTALLMFDTLVYRQLVEGGAEVEPDDSADVLSMIESEQEHLVHREDWRFLFEALKNNAHPRRQGYLFCNAEFDIGGHVFYIFNPYAREEVKFYKHYKEVVRFGFQELICSYSVYAAQSYTMLNGIDKDQITPRRYRIVAEVDGNGYYHGYTDMTFDVDIKYTQMIAMNLRPRLTVDSIIDDRGRPVSFVRWKDWDNRSRPLYVIFDHALNDGETLSLTFFVRGEMGKRRIGDMYLIAGSDWYPRYGYRKQAMFELNFKTPRKYGFVATGQLMERRESEDYLLTRWETDRPVAAASFNIGRFEATEFTEENAPPVKVMYLQQLHEDSTRELLSRYGDDDDPDAGRERVIRGSNMTHQVANDIIGALRLCGLRFGDYPGDRLVVSEILSEPRAESVENKDFAGTVPVRPPTQIGEYTDAAGPSPIGATSSIGLGTDRPQSSVDLRIDYAFPDVDMFDDTLRVGIYRYAPQGYAGQVFLPYTTFDYSDPFGRDALLRARQVGHQWWGAGVNIETYRDHWLTAGFAEYSALLYLQAAEGNERFSFWLKEYRDDILEVNRFMLGNRQAAGSVALGYRTATTESRDDFPTIVYRKGAFILHMLRNMLLDFDTFSEDAFYSMMREFYTTYAGRTATTADFQAVTEKYTGMDMSWFFREWVYNPEVPTYTFTYELNKAEDGNYVADCRIVQSNVPEDFRMVVPIEIEFESGARHYLRVMVDKPEVEVTLPPINRKPKKITLNPLLSVLAEVK